MLYKWLISDVSMKERMKSTLTYIKKEGKK